MNLAQLIVGGIISAVIAGIPTLLILGPNRNKYRAEAASTNADVQVKLVGPALTMYEKAEERAAAADAKADRCVAQLDGIRSYVDALHDHVDLLENLLVTHGVLRAEIPPMPRLPPAPLGFPKLAGG